MSFSVDDLVASLNSSHIGQEAMDLATLQAQLAATLFPARTPRATASHHCTTPLARTPSNSISMGSMSIDMTMSMRANSRRGSYSTPHHGHGHSLTRNDMPVLTSNAAYHHHHHHHYQHTSPFDETLEEDERMVEDLLLPPPNSASSSSFHHETGATLSSSNTTSSFTTSDPFYLSQLQASQQAFVPNPATTQSLFAQNGRITQGSQFALQTAF